MECFRCGSELKVEECEDIDYPFYCPVCNENMYMFEGVEDEVGIYIENWDKN